MTARSIYMRSSVTASVSNISIGIMNVNTVINVTSVSIHGKWIPDIIVGWIIVPIPA